MAGICTNSVRAGGGDCEHLTLTVLLDGETRTIKTGFHDGRWNVPLDSTEKDLLLKLLARWWKGKGSNLASFAGRVLAGEEGTNVREYNLIGPGAAIVKTNVGATYANVSPALNGERTIIDFTGCTEFRIGANFIIAATQTGLHRIAVLRDSDGLVLWESSDISGAGEKEVLTGWLTLPAQATGELTVRAAIRSSVAADDPTVRRVKILVR